MLAYPSPHRIRRNYTLYPFRVPDPPNLFRGDPTAPAPPTDLMINTTVTKENVDYIVNNFEGDFIGFQMYMEKIPVSLVVSPQSLCGPDRPVQGLHAGIHLIISG